MKSYIIKLTGADESVGVYYIDGKKKLTAVNKALAEWSKKTPTVGVRNIDVKSEAI